MNRLTDFWDRNKAWFRFSLGAAFFWGLLAHAYCFFNNAFSHDSLNEFHGAIFGNDVKLVSGRIFVPLYRDLLRSDVTLPWLIGFLSLLWIGLAVFLVIRIFRIESRGLAFLTAGIFAVNISVSATAATYLHDLDSDMFSLLLAVGAVYLWKYVPKGWLLGALLITGSLGIYQSFVFSAAALVMMVSILELLKGEDFAGVFCRGLKAVGMILLGGILYYLALRVSQSLSGIALSSGDYNSLDLMSQLTPAYFVELAIGAYRDFGYRLLNAYSTYPAILVKAMTLVLLGISAAALLLGLLRKGLGWKEKLLLLCLTVLLPLVMNLIYVLTLGASHDLMVYPIWLTWLLALLLSQWLWEQKKERPLCWQKPLCMLLVAALLYGSVQFANGMYQKKDQEYDAYLSLMTRVAYRMEECPDYVPGQTPVVFVGIPGTLNPVMPGFKDYWNVTGMQSSNVIFMPEQSRYQAYFDYVLGVPLVQVPWETMVAVKKEAFVAQMPSYPEPGCMQLQEGMLIVKFSEEAP